MHHKYCDLLSKDLSKHTVGVSLVKDQNTAWEHMFSRKSWFLGRLVYTLNAG